MSKTPPPRSGITLATGLRAIRTPFGLAFAVAEAGRVYRRSGRGDPQVRLVLVAEHDDRLRALVAEKQSLVPSEHSDVDPGEIRRHALDCGLVAEHRPAAAVGGGDGQATSASSRTKTKPARLMCASGDTRPTRGRGAARQQTAPSTGVNFDRVAGAAEATFRAELIPA